ncbi:MAG TPA: UvrD-helicase domain-containing protein [Candidatus Methanomethylophilaceae archaeon]|nr:UvrD-helicase domain-containing protein [Candidatus Methanomethylophilaceae archaeon]
MTSKPNPAQKKISESLDGFYVVDAGPGTGKTFTIVNRYVNIVSRPDIQTKDVLLLTFTRNAAAEMEERIREKLTSSKLEKDTRLVQAGTFDSFCYSIVKESPEVVSDFLGFRERLTRGATLIENETLNREYFSDFFDMFSAERGEEYGDVAIIASTVPSTIYGLISKLMSKGIVPLSKGWFGGGDGKDLLGDTDKIMSLLEKMNSDLKARKESLKKIQKNMDEGMLYAEGFPILDDGMEIPADILEASAFEDRTDILEFIHDVYYDFIRHCVADDRLTFGLNSVFAFLILYSNKGVRDRMSCRYVMIDEFQDTNENQMMIALMLLKEPNLCVVGDWKQGIYGFRFVSIENITDFEKRAVTMRSYLNDDNERVPFKIPVVNRLSLDVNYRSSQEVIDTSFRVLNIQGTQKEIVHLDVKTVVELTAGNEKIGDNTHVRYVQVPKEDEASESVSRIIDYVTGNYSICDGDKTRKPNYGDIAVICKNGKMCRAVYENATERGVPAFLQGDVEIMSTREGKLLLSWMKYLNNKRDSWGLTGILSDMEYNINDIRRILRPDKDGNFAEAPSEILAMRAEFIKKKRRITDLISSIFTYYGLNNDVTQAIITTMSTAYRSSLLTISDLIRIIETDIKEHNTYNIDANLDTDAVLIQTMHKSKGLEYPIVIIPQLNKGVIPNHRGDYSDITYSEIEGVRCSKNIVSVDEFHRIGRSWKTELVRSALERDFSEDRRTLFVAISRAKQYVTMICSNSPSNFIKELSGGEYLGSVGNLMAPIRETYVHVVNRPDLEPFEPRRRIIGVHDIMTFESGTPGEGSDEISGKGMEYGTKVHAIAEGLARGIEPRESKEDIPEISAIKEILNSLNDADLILVEVPCSLPLNDINVTLRGIIDLLALYPDHAVVHDYKTDVSKNNLDTYKLQLSVYANAVSGYYKRPVKCVINFISLGESEEFEPMSNKDIASHVQPI